MRSYLAIEITTDDGYGIPISYTNAGFGAVAGVFALITGRPGLDGSKTVTGDTDRDTWYQGILAEEGDFVISEDADFIEAGCIAAVSTFSFSVLNTGAFANALRNASFTDLLGVTRTTINLARCRVKVFYVSSTDGLTFDFRQMNQFVIDDQPYDELNYKIKCVSDAVDVFKSLPSQAADDSKFSDINPVENGNMIPIALGRVAYSPMLAVNTSGKKVTMVLSSGPSGWVESPSCAAAAYNGTAAPVAPPDSSETIIAATVAPLEIWLLTQNVNFQENDSRLVGSFLNIITGGNAQSRKILSNRLTQIAYGSYVTRTTIQEPFDTPPEFKRWLSVGGEPAPWFFQVGRHDIDLVVSNSEISEFLGNQSSHPRLFIYDNTEKSFLSIAELKIVSSLENVNNAGYPGVQIVAKTLGADGDINGYFKIKPLGVQVIDRSHWTGPAGDQPKLYDETRNADADADAFMFFDSFNTHQVSFSIDLPSDELLKFSEIYLCMDVRHNVYCASNIGAGSLTLIVDVDAQDIYNLPSQFPYVVIDGRELFSTITGDSAPPFSTDSASTTFSDMFYLPDTYYELDGPSQFFYTRKSRLNISSLIDSLKKTTAFPRLRLTIRGSFGTPNQFRRYKGKFIEIGLVGKKAINLASESVYASVIGETFGSTWNARKTATEPILLLGDALEAGIRKYDTGVKPWRSRVYRQGEKAQPTADNGHLYLCTTGGAASASEPIWPTSSGGTVTDGAVVWKEWKTIPIDEPSFEDVGDLRYNWPIGRTLTDKKKSSEYYAELCRQGFLGLYFDADGKVSITAWLNSTSPLVNFNSSSGGNILADSMGPMVLSPMRRVYNYGRVRYDWNPAQKVFNKQLFIDRIDSPSFPPPEELADQYENDLGTFSIFVIPPEVILTGTGLYYYDITCAVAHGLVTGDFVSLVNNTETYNFTSLPVSVVDEFAFTVTVPTINKQTTPSTTGTLYKNTSKNLEWKNYVGGVEDYVKAMELWNQAHLSYLVTKQKQPWPADLGDCYWFIDPKAAVPGSNPESPTYFWPDLSDSGDNHPAFFHLQNMLSWTAWQKYQVEFETEMADPQMQIHVFSPVTVTDSKQTHGETWRGWVHRIKRIKGMNGGPDKLAIGVTFAPNQITSSTQIVETGSQAINIIESGSQITNYIEGAQ